MENRILQLEILFFLVMIENYIMMWLLVLIPIRALFLITL